MKKNAVKDNRIIPEKMPVTINASVKKEVKPDLVPIAGIMDISKDAIAVDQNKFEKGY